MKNKVKLKLIDKLNSLSFKEFIIDEACNVYYYWDTSFFDPEGDCFAIVMPNRMVTLVTYKGSPEAFIHAIIDRLDLFDGAYGQDIMRLLSFIQETEFNYFIENGKLGSFDEAFIKTYIV